MRRKKKEEIEVFIGSGNVFEDLGYADPEEALAKAKLAHQIHKIIKKRRLTQKRAAEIMGIDQPKVSDIIRGKLSRYSIERLMRFLRLLGKGIEINLINREGGGAKKEIISRMAPLFPMSAKKR